MKSFTVDDTLLRTQDDVLEYKETAKKERTTLNCGQRKLLLIEIYFLSRFWNSDDIRNPKIIYVGAAPGHHISVLSFLFPAIEFHLYDPAKFLITATAAIRLYNKKFTDIDAEQWSNRNDIFFFSDIRQLTYAQGENKADVVAVQQKNEELVINDMRDQEKWYNIIKPVRAMMKMRLPYAYNFMPKYFRYLNGYILKQPWAPQTSTETRIVPTNDKESDNKEVDYEIKKYGDQMFYFNTVVRQEDKYLNIIDDSEKAIDPPELMNDFDSTYESFILFNYFIKINKDPTIDDIKRLSRYITTELSRLLNRNLSLDYLRKNKLECF